MIKEDNMSGRDIGIDMIRVICCVMVVAIHSPAFYNTALKPNIHAVIHCAVPCFMAVSGYLIFFRREYEYKQILLGPFKRYLIIFLLWDCVYILYYYFLTDKTESFLRYAVSNSEGWHLWYLKVYLQIIVVYPLIRAITSRKRLTLLYSILWFAFFSIRFTVGCIPGIEFVFLRLIQLPFFQYSGYIAGTPLAYHPTECLGMFIAGGGLLSYIKELQKDRESQDQYKKVIRVFTVIGGLGYGIAMIAVNIAYQIDPDRLFKMSVTQSHFYVVMEAVGLIAAVYLLLQYFNSNKFCRTVRFLADKTLGIYILHPIIITILEKNRSLNALRGGYDKPCNIFRNPCNGLFNSDNCALAGSN